jgi:hypothetical protein
MTVLNQKAVTAYLHSKEEMPCTMIEEIAWLTDWMACRAFEVVVVKPLKPLSTDAMMAIESTIFVELCNANGIDWRNLCD